MRTAEVAEWINERHAIYLRKGYLLGTVGGSLDGAWGAQDDWTLLHLTNDPILHSYRFCNVFRELDRVTIWIRENIIEPYAHHEHLWFMLAIARTINWPPTLHQVICEYPGAWPAHTSASGSNLFSPAYLADALDNWKDMGNKVYTGAYMIRAESNPYAPWYKWTKQRYVGEIVLGKLWDWRRRWMEILEEPGVKSQVAWEQFQKFTGWGPFMAYQVVADLQHTRYLRDSPDKHSWAAAGPGTIRGLNRWLDRDPKAPMSPEEALKHLLELRHELHAPKTLAHWVPTPIDLSDVCNICCEFDKYQRVLWNEGKPRAKYVPGRGW